MGPQGRVAVSLGVSAVMLAGGVVLERREKYRAAARGLIGGGWAALYSTTYAAHAVEAARVVTSPTVATVLLAAVAVGMILHSLRYRSQTVTGLSYFVAFVTLAISPLTFYAVIALVPLAASLVYLAHRFRWSTVGLVGMPATYGIYLIHAARSSGGSLATGQSVLLVYWLVFELFDVLYAVRMRSEPWRPIPGLPLNAALFVLASLVQWQASSPETLYVLFMLAATAYLASAALRLVLLPVSGFPQGTLLVNRMQGGSYEGALALAAAFTAVASALKLSGLTISVAFLIEAELLFFAGLYYRQRFLRHLATALLVISVARMLGADVQQAAHTAIAGRDWHAWSPVALLHAGAFYLNHFLLRRGSLHLHMATGLLVLVLGFEAPSGLVAITWAALGLGLYELSERLRQPALKVQSYVLAVPAFVAACAVNLDLEGSLLGLPRRTLSTLAVIAMFYAAQFLVARRPSWKYAGPMFSGLATGLLAVLLAHEVSGSLLTVAWGAQGVALLIAGFPLRQRCLRLSGLALLLVCVGKLFGYDLRYLDMPSRVLSFLVLGVLLIGVSFIYSRFRERISRYL
jgi:hypothetical protein